MILLFDEVGNGLKVVPEHIGLTDENDGVTLELTVIDNVVVVAHCPEVGVNVYVVVFVLSNAGDQVPVILLFDEVGNALNDAPEHIGLTDENDGVTLELTVIVNVLVVAHCPEVGVNVYVVVFVLSNAGDQVPVILLFDEVGNALNEVPEHIGLTDENDGVNLELTVIVNVLVVAHCPEVGVNVYVVVFVLSNAGDQVPVILLFDEVGNALNEVPEHIGLTDENDGVTFCTVVIANELASLVPQPFVACTIIFPVIGVFEAVTVIVFEELVPVKPEGKVQI